MLALNFHPFPGIETERLILRQIEEPDIHSLFLMRSDPETMKYIDKPLAETTEDVMPIFTKMQEDIQNNKGISWVIQLKDSRAMIGNIGFWRIDKENHRGEVGYMLSRNFFRKGIGSEALKVVIDYGFNYFNFHSIEANVNPANEASIRLLEKYGFKREAYFRENYYFAGKFIDTAIYSLLASEWRNAV